MPFTSDVYSPSNPRVKKLTQEQRRQIVDLYENGFTTRAIALQFGVS